MAQKLEQQLKELGSKLENPPTAKDSLVKLLKQAGTYLSELDQSLSKSMLDSMQPFLSSIVKPELLKHQDREIKLLVGTCICEITRITAPNAPYDDEVLKDIFDLIVSTFSGLSDTSGASFGRRVVILETLARYRSCVVMLDLGCDDLIRNMFSTFFSVARDDHSESVLSSMQKIMIVLLEESEEVEEDLLIILLSVLGRNNADFTKAARRLALNVIEHCAGKLEPGIKQFLVSLMTGDNRSLNSHIDHHEIIYDIYRCAPQIISAVVPYLTGELLTDQLEIRLKAVRLVGDLFAVPGSVIHETFRPIFMELLKRLSDRVVEVRLSVLERVKICLMSNPFRPEAPQIISSLCDRLLDYDESVRKQVVGVIFDVACHSVSSIPVATIKLVAERVRDKSLLVKKYTMERLADVFRASRLSRPDDASHATSSEDFDWIPGKILRCFYDKDFRSDIIEPILCGCLFPSEFSINQKAVNWIKVFSVFDKVDINALEKILEQKQRLQKEMQRYLSLRQVQAIDASLLEKKKLYCFRIMSHCFSDPGKAGENFLILDQLRDANIWKILVTLINPTTGSVQACNCRDDLQKILGEKHGLYDFLSTLSLKCSYSLFNKEHVREILLEAGSQKSAGNTQFTLSCMNILEILARFCPLLFSGIEKELVRLLEGDNEVIKEGILHVLSKAGGAIRDLEVSPSSLDLILERICVEGSRRQAKYAVQALGAVTKDGGLKSLSVLYKRLVDMLKENTNVPAVLQSLGCLAQIAISVYQTREKEIEEFLKENILEQSNKTGGHETECWDSRSDLCSFKIFGIKTLVKSYLPVKDAHHRLGITGLLEILKNILSFGEISKEIKSSTVDKAHLRLAAAKAVLRLSKVWDSKIPVDLFHLSLRSFEIGFPQAKKQFLSKLHQYVKDRVLDPKYACAFFLDISGCWQPGYVEGKHIIGNIFQICEQRKAHQLSLRSSDADSLVTYPEYIIIYFVHALAHHPSCPNVDECRDVKAFEPIYRQLYLFLSMLINGNEDDKSEVSIAKKKESIRAVRSIFQNIKLSEDSFDPEKSKNSHAISDLGLSITKRLALKEDEGLSITKRLALKEDDIHEPVVSVRLPPMLYKLPETQEEPLVNKRHTWLGDETILTHFESLKFDVSDMNRPAVADHEVDLNEDGTYGNEVPLGKILRSLKAKGNKARKMKTENLPVAPNKEEEDALKKMAGETYLDDLGISSKTVSSNGHECIPETMDIDQISPKGKRRHSDEENFLALKRGRTSSSDVDDGSLPRDMSKDCGKKPTDDSNQDEVSSLESTEMDEKLHVDSAEPAESDLLVTGIKKKYSESLLRRNMNSFNKHNVGDVDHNIVKRDDFEEIDTAKMASTSKSSTSLVKRRKSTAGLSKCKTKGVGIETMDLLDCRIKVWWPVDKKFYVGVVKSYDPEKKKHVVLYDDGDVEVVRLDKERWILVDNGQKLAKRKKVAKGRHKELSASSKVIRKRTPKKKTEHKQMKFVASSLVGADSGRSFTKITNLNSSDSEEEHNGSLERSLTGGKESDENRHLDSEVDTVKSDGEETEQDELISDAERTKSVATTSHDSEGPQRFNDASMEKSIDGDKSEPSNSDGTDVDDRETNSRSPHTSDEPDISDDEPLIMWKQRHVGKPVR